MQQCEGITLKGKRCKKRADHELDVHGAVFDVCIHHRVPNILSRWNREMYRRWKKDIPGDDIPSRVNSWLESLHACWNDTKNLQVSTKYASHMYANNELRKPFGRKFEAYVGSLVTDNSTHNTECGICMEETYLTQTKCKHTYCMTCINKWMKKSVTCPMCRSIL